MDTAGEFSGGLRQEFQEGRAARPGELRVLKPVGHTDEIERRRGEHMLQMGLGRADVAGPTQITAAHPLGDGALHARAHVVVLLERRAGLELARGLQGEVLLLGADAEPATVAGGGAAGALRAHLAGPAGELDVDHLLAAAVLTRRPADAGVPGRTDGALLLPVDHKDRKSTRLNSS